MAGPVNKSADRTLGAGTRGRKARAPREARHVRTQHQPDKQARVHRGPLTGIGMVLLFVAIIVIATVVFMSGRSGGPEGAASQVDGRTGATEEAAAGATGSRPTTTPRTTSPRPCPMPRP
jgi:hypothetical protein